MDVQIQTSLADASRYQSRYTYLTCVLTHRIPQDSVNYVAVDIRQAEITSRVAIRQLRVVESQVVQDCRVEIVNVDGVFRDVVANFVRCSVNDARPDAAAGQPAGERRRVMSPALCSLAVLSPG